jgi:hypothetical protein
MSDQFESNPWNFGDVSAPDGIKQVIVTNVGEVGMGAPSSATAHYCNGEVDHVISDKAGGPCVWSTDSRYIALPIWTPLHNQVIGIFDTLSLKLKISNDRFNVLHLKKFEQNIIAGTDRFYHIDKPFTFDATEILDAFK